MDRLWWRSFLRQLKILLTDGILIKIVMSNWFLATAATLTVLYLNARHHQKEKKKVKNKKETYPQVFVLPNMNYRRFYEQPREDTRRDGLTISSVK